MTAHPVDRLAEVKAQIAELERERDVLRWRIITGECEPIGSEWQAVVSGRQIRSIAVNEAQQVLPAALFEQLCTRTEQQLVRLRRLE